MALTRVQGTAKVTGGSAGLTIPLASPPVVGNAVIVVLNCQAPTTGVTASDNYGNSYFVVASNANGSNASCAILLCPSLTATGTAFTVTVSLVTSYLVGSAIEVSGATGGGLGVDQVGLGTGSSTTPATTATAALRSNEVFAVALIATGQISPTSITVQSVSPTWLREWQLLTWPPLTGEADSRDLTGVLGTTPSCSWTLGSSVTWSAIYVAFASNAALPVPAARVSQDAVEVLTTTPTSAARVSQDVIEVLTTTPTNQARISQYVVEILVSSTPGPSVAVSGVRATGTVGTFGVVIVTGAPRSMPVTTYLFASDVVTYLTDPGIITYVGDTSVTTTQ